LIGRIDVVRARLAIESMVRFLGAVGQAATDAFARLDNRYFERRGTTAHELHGGRGSAEPATRDDYASRALYF